MILDTIVENKKGDLDAAKKAVPQSDLERKIAGLNPPADFKQALKGPGVKLIAEVKKASPSKGLICPDFDPLRIAQIYAENGAAAISVLTERRYFQGNLEYLNRIKKTLGDKCPPLLRKDFIFDPYQIYECRANGADACLLIVAILEYRKLVELLELSHRLCMQCLVEVHNEDEVARAVAAGADIIGINNRDLRTFEVKLETTAGLRSLIPADKIVVSESGIKTRQDLQQLADWGINAALVGETLVAASDIAAKMKELIVIR
jgi:indole-3-glycerol phosphate synthase